jgi:cytochrome P450
LLDPQTIECPYDFYANLRAQAPVFLDPISGFYVVSRFDDVREILRDPATYSSDDLQLIYAQINRKQAMRAAMAFTRRGWLPARTIIARNDPAHRELRIVFDRLFKSSRIASIEPEIEQVATKLMRPILDKGHCDWVAEFAIPMPLLIIGKQMGANEQDLFQIRQWISAAAKRFGLMANDEEFAQSVNSEIEAQHYFQPIFARLRTTPDDTYLSELVNTPIEEWARPLDDRELLAEIIWDFFGAGSETTTSALASGMMLLIQNLEILLRLKADPGRWLKPFIEEILRLESPIQGTYRIATRDVSLNGTTIPKNAIVNVRIGAANRDEGRFERPDALDLDRDHLSMHMAFGAGIHYCAGSALARRELFWGFKTFLARIGSVRFAPNKNDFAHGRSYILRSLNELHIEFDCESSV